MDPITGEEILKLWSETNEITGVITFTDEVTGVIVMSSNLVPDNAILGKDGEPLLTKDGDYILTK